MLDDHVRSSQAECVGRAAVRVRYCYLSGGVRRQDFHCPIFRAVRPDGVVRYCWSTSPEWFGVSWQQGEADSPEEAAAALARAWRAGEAGTVESGAFEPAPEYGPARVEWRSRQARLAFALDMAASGGVALASRRHSSSAALITRRDAAPAPELASGAEALAGVPDGWEMSSLLARPLRREP